MAQDDKKLLQQQQRVMNTGGGVEYADKKSPAMKNGPIVITKKGTATTTTNTRLSFPVSGANKTKNPLVLVESRCKKENMVDVKPLISSSSSSDLLDDDSFDYDQRMAHIAAKKGTTNPLPIPGNNKTTKAAVVATSVGVRVNSTGSLSSAAKAKTKSIVAATPTGTTQQKQKISKPLVLSMSAEMAKKPVVIKDSARSVLRNAVASSQAPKSGCPSSVAAPRSTTIAATTPTFANTAASRKASLVVSISKKTDANKPASSGSGCGGGGGHIALPPNAQKQQTQGQEQNHEGKEVKKEHGDCRDDEDVTELMGLESKGDDSFGVARRVRENDVRDSFIRSTHFQNEQQQQQQPRQDQPVLVRAIASTRCGHKMSDPARRLNCFLEMTNFPLESLPYYMEEIQESRLCRQGFLKNGHSVFHQLSSRPPALPLVCASDYAAAGLFVVSPDDTPRKLPFEQQPIPPQPSHSPAGDGLIVQQLQRKPRQLKRAVTFEERDQQHGSNSSSSSGDGRRQMVVNEPKRSCQREVQNFKVNMEKKFSYSSQQTRKSIRCGVTLCVNCGLLPLANAEDVRKTVAVRSDVEAYEMCVRGTACLVFHQLTHSWKLSVLERDVTERQPTIRYSPIRDVDTRLDGDLADWRAYATNSREHLDPGSSSPSGARKGKSYTVRCRDLSHKWDHILIVANVQQPERVDDGDDEREEEELNSPPQQTQRRVGFSEAPPSIDRMSSNITFDLTDMEEDDGKGEEKIEVLEDQHHRPPDENAQEDHRQKREEGKGQQQEEDLLNPPEDGNESGGPPPPPSPPAPSAGYFASADEEECFELD